MPEEHAKVDSGSDETPRKPARVRRLPYVPPPMNNPDFCFTDLDYWGPCRDLDPDYIARQTEISRIQFLGDAVVVLKAWLAKRYDEVREAGEQHNAHPAKQ